MILLILIAFFFAAVYFSVILALRIGLNYPGHCVERDLTTVSIIVAMKNERENARSCLEALIRQTYPADKLEIIVVDDGSTDGTLDILADYQSRHAGLKVIQHRSHPQNSGGKKSALSRGIAESSGQILLFTDADCIPPADWAYAMTACFAPPVGLVVGFSPLIDPTNCFFGKLMLIDSLANGAVAAGSIGLGGAVTCTGRNLAYRRQVYEQVNGFSDIRHSLSGDDDLLLQLVHHKTDWKIRFVNDNDAVVPSYQTRTLKELSRQKMRHLSAGKYYRFPLQLAYLLFHLANFFLYCFLIISIVTGQNFWLAALLLAAKFLSDALLIIATGKMVRVQARLKYILAWEIFFVLYHLILAPFSWMAKIRWK